MPLLFHKVMLQTFDVYGKPEEPRLLAVFEDKLNADTMVSDLNRTIEYYARFSARFYVETLDVDQTILDAGKK